MKNFLFKDRDGQTQLPPELRKGLKPKTINTMGDLDYFEEANIAKGLIWFAQQKPEKVLEMNFWLKAHKQLFGDVWTWAGEIRKHELQNEEFKQPHQILPELKKLVGDLKYWVEERPFEDDREIVARFHERFLTIHPFANGNGRTGRILTDLLSKRLKLPNPTWGRHLLSDKSKRRSEYIANLKLARQARSFRGLIEFVFN